MFGALPQSKAGTKYIFVRMDIFTKYTRLYALSKANTEVLLGKMRSFIQEVGKPEVVLSEKGTQFISGLWQQELDELNIVPSTVSVRHLQGNPVEHIMKTIGSTLRTYLHVATSVTPHDALTYQRSEPLNVLSIPKLPDMQDASMEQQPLQREVQQLISTRLYSEALKRKGGSKLSKLNNLEVGELVLVKTNLISSLWSQVMKKFFHLYEGPNEIYDVKQINCYPVSDPITKQIVGNYNIRALRKFVKWVVEAE
ncbi:hypothetical protein PR048_006801 [Dryococelus australis]|uniref:Integrase catalytic domain-containing protein n=1 Tax=Dryococelus australis TaxID=614101 RepID=A0ABQ9IC04_9NEOP|nr:hypothetical protein PR048_006801 [Dryococelus australis]